MSWGQKNIRNPRRILVFCLLLTLIFLSVFLLTLNSTYVRKKVEQRVTRITQIPFHYKKAQLTAVNQITLKEVACGKNTSIPEIKIDLNLMKSLRTRELTIQRVTVDSPHISIDLDKLEQKLKESAKKQIKPPAVALAQSLPKKTPNAKPLTAPVTKKSPKKKAPKTVKPVPKVAEINRHYPALSVNNSTLIFHSKRLPKERFTLTGVSIDTKAGTNSSQGVLRWKSSHKETEIEFPIALEGKKLSIPKHTQEILGTKLTLGGSIGLISALPCAFEMQVQSTKPVAYHLPNDDMLSVHLDALATQLRIRGQLSAPHTLQAISQSHLANFTPHHKTRGEHNFETGRIDIRLFNGQIHIPSFALQSEELSLMGNGMGSIDEFNLVCRTITNDIWQEHGTKLIHGLRIPSKLRPFSPLETEERFFNDSYLRITPATGVEFSLNPKKKWTSLGTCWKSAKTFLVRELWTEEQ